MKTGDKDGRKGKSYDPERSHYFHDAGFGITPRHTATVSRAVIARATVSNTD
jgi:hypothetical protein